MGLLGRAGQNVAQRRDYGDVGWPLFPPRDPGGKASIGYRSTMTIPTVWSCVMLRADMVSTMPVRTYTMQKDADGNSVKTEVRNPPLIQSPSADIAFDEWMFASQVSLDLRGNAYGVIVSKDAQGRPTQVELQHPDTVRVREETSGAIRYYIAGSSKGMTSEEVWHERQFVMPGSVVGLSVIENFARTLRIPIQAESYGDEWFGQGAHPSGILSNRNVRTLEDGVADTIKRRFMAKMQGRQEPVVLSGGWDWTTIQIAPGESQFLETQSFGALQIARIFRVPATFLDLDAGSSMHYTNVENRGLQFLTYSMAPTFRRRLRALQQCSPSMNVSEFDTSQLLQTDRLTEAKTDAMLITAAIQTQNEVRARRGLPPLTDSQVKELLTFKVNMSKAVTSSESSDSGSVGTDPTDIGD